MSNYNLQINNLQAASNQSSSNKNNNNQSDNDFGSLISSNNNSNETSTNVTSNNNASQKRQTSAVNGNNDNNGNNNNDEVKNETNSAYNNSSESNNNTKPATATEKKSNEDSDNEVTANQANISQTTEIAELEISLQANNIEIIQPQQQHIEAALSAINNRDNVLLNSNRNLIANSNITDENIVLSGEQVDDAELQLNLSSSIDDNNKNLKLSEVLEQLQQRNINADKNLQTNNTNRQISEFIQNSNISSDNINLVSQNNQFNNTLQNVQPSTVQISVDKNFTSPNWDNAFNNRITWLVNRGIQSAQIHIDPPELGPVDVSINLQKDSANILFTSNVGQVRDAIEQAIPKLREMFESQGLNLANVDVSDGRGEDNSQGSSHSHAKSDSFTSDSIVESGINTSTVSKGLIDYFV